MEVLEEIKAIAATYQSQPLARDAIRKRLKGIAEGEPYMETTAATIINRLDAIEEKLGTIQADARAAAAKGTRPAKARTTRKSDQ